jgi:hypothetical protein
MIVRRLESNIDEKNLRLRMVDWRATASWRVLTNMTTTIYFLGEVMASWYYAVGYLQFEFVIVAVRKAA